VKERLSHHPVRTNCLWVSNTVSYPLIYEVILVVVFCAVAPCGILAVRQCFGIRY
jgi:hypothetical protein